MTTIYVGPYLVVPPIPVKSSTRERACSNHCAAPAISKPARFCANCGGAVEEFDLCNEQVMSLPIWKLDARWEDFMACPDHGQRHPKGAIWLPNRYECGRISLRSGAEDVFSPVALSDINGAAMLEKAQLHYGDFVAALKADWGIDAFWEVGIWAYSF